MDRAVRTDYAIRAEKGVSLPFDLHSRKSLEQSRLFLFV